MKLYVYLTAVLLVCACSAPKQSGQEHDFSDGALLAKVQNRTNQLTKLTTRPIEMISAITKLCNVPPQFERHFPSATESAPQAQTFVDPQKYIEPKADIGVMGHLSKEVRYAQTYISQEATSVAKANDKGRIYPTGTLVIKEKVAHPDGSGTELFTGMLKREADYFPESGGWEFLVFSADAKTVTARGKINSCLDCHSRHQRTDYLTESWKENTAN